MAISSLPNAVIKITGTCGYSRRTATTRSRPFISGMSRSVSSASGCCSEIAFSASTPFLTDRAVVARRLQQHANLHGLSGAVLGNQNVAHDCISETDGRWVRLL